MARSTRSRGRGPGVAGRVVLLIALLAGCDDGDTTAPVVRADPAAAEGAQPLARADPGAKTKGTPGSDASPTPADSPRGDRGEAALEEIEEIEAVDEPPPPPTEADAGSCPETDDPAIGILVSPSRPAEGETVRIVAASLDDEAALALRIDDGEGKALTADLVHRPGVPAATIARLTAPAAGSRIRAVVGRDGKGLRCLTVRVHRAVERRIVSSALADGVWPVEREWNAAEEALFSAWVRELFHAPRGEELAWTALHEVTGDASRNVLHDHFAWGEDSEPMKGGLYLRPDCADTPYFLRAYFAWKRRLPFGFRQCSRGSGGKAPACGDLRGVMGKPDVAPVDRLPGEMGVVQRYFKRTLAWGVHSGNGRTAFAADDTDYYPLALTRRALRPGMIYADPYGHLFVLVEMMPAEGDEPGVLYAIDGQPDGSITRKRFWEGNFLWNPDPALGGSGFKGFRPHLVEGRGADRRLVAATNEQLATLEGYGDLDPSQAELDGPGFYDRMDAIITPGLRDPFKAQAEAIAALHESALVRVTSVDNGEAFFAESHREIDMPDGFSIFETTGSWENYSTPARDLRLLIAIDLATGFEAKVARNPAAWGVEQAGGLAAVSARLASERERLLASEDLAFSYTRTDGSKWTLTLAELVTRTKAFEVAYNPNDCPEVRWGAPERSAERSTCRRRAPALQQRKMAAYRAWFRERRRPARGDPGPPVE